MSDFKPELWKRSGSGKMGEGTRQKWGEHGGINKSLIVKEFLYSMLGNMKSIQREWEALVFFFFNLSWMVLFKGFYNTTIFIVLLLNVMICMGNKYRLRA